MRSFLDKIQDASLTWQQQQQARRSGDGTTTAAAVGNMQFDDDDNDDSILSASSSSSDDASSSSSDGSQSSNSLQDHHHEQIVEHRHQDEFDQQNAGAMEEEEEANPGIQNLDAIVNQNRHNVNGDQAQAREEHDLHHQADEEEVRSNRQERLNDEDNHFGEGGNNDNNNVEVLGNNNNNEQQLPLDDLNHPHQLLQQDPHNAPQLTRSTILHNLLLLYQKEESKTSSLSSSQQSLPTNTNTPMQIGTAREGNSSSSSSNDTSDSSNLLLLLRVARSEELPLIRADINWALLSTQLKHYPSQTIGDVHGAFLLQSILRMDPPCNVIRETIKLYPKSCINMDSFYTACQYASDDAVIQLLMRRTMKARRREGIQWGMLAFLGDARIQVRHARFLLSSIPQAVVDEMHGMFGVSPLDRMLSGAFIHGEYGEWVGKLKLALWTAERGSVFGYDDCTSSNNSNVDRVDVASIDSNSTKIGDNNYNNKNEKGSTTNPQSIVKRFFPFHSLVRRLIHGNFRGTHFGPFSFIRTLVACVQSSPEAPPFHQKDDDGNLPIHIILRSECKTTLGTEGERKLIKFLLRTNLESVFVPDGIDGKLPLRLSIENGWPCYDIIINACRRNAGSFSGVPNNTDRQNGVSSVNQQTSTTNDTNHIKGSIGTSVSSSIRQQQPILHTALTGPFHTRFGISGARTMIEYILQKFPNAAKTLSLEGRLPLHVAIENGWPCHDLLLSAAPLALETRDKTNKFYPFQIASFSQQIIVPSFQEDIDMELNDCSMSGTSNNNDEGNNEDTTEILKPDNTVEGEGGRSHTSKEAINQQRKKDLTQLSVLYELIRESPVLLQFTQDNQRIEHEPVESLTEIKIAAVDDKVITTSSNPSRKRKR